MSNLTQIISILFYVIGGLGIFMLGMKYMSEGVQTIAGPSLREMISRVTNNRFLAVATGTTFTLLVQSSSIATVIMVGLVNAGLMQLHQAVGFIMGANIGTTITGWILVLQVGKYGLPVLGVAALFFVFTKNDRVRFIAMATMGLGMVFFGLQLMKEGVEPVRQMEGIDAWIQQLSVDSFLGILTCVAMGCALTFLVQSSSAALGILIAAAATGLVPFPVAAAFILGENIGTTTTVLLASLGATKNAKRAAVAHLVFNVTGVIWAVLAFPIFIQLIGRGIEWFHGINPITMNYSEMDPTEYGMVITASIASFHSSFNIANTLLFLPFLQIFSRTLERIIPAPAIAEKPSLRHLEARNIDCPSIGIEQSRMEIMLMGRHTVEMMEQIKELFYKDSFSDELEKRAIGLEDKLDSMEREVVTFLTEILQSTVPLSIVEAGRSQLRLAHEYESTSDCLANIAKEFRRLRARDQKFAECQLSQLSAVHDDVFLFLQQSLEEIRNPNTISPQAAKQQSKKISAHIADLHERNINRIIETNLDPHLAMAFASILTHYRRARANVLNAHQAANGGKGVASPTKEPASTSDLEPA